MNKYRKNQRRLLKKTRDNKTTRQDNAIPRTIPCTQITRGEGIGIILTIIVIMLMILFAYLEGLFVKSSS